MFNTIFEALADLKKGKMLIVVDDENRENEGDFVIPAVNATPEVVNFMTQHGRGLICAPITETLSHELDLPLMVDNNEDDYKTAFTISVDAHKKYGVTTGISVFDRSETLKRLADSNSTAFDFTRPGHIFPLIAKNDGVLERPGHTEAAVDLARLSGFSPVGVICEILNLDGRAARLNDLLHLSKQMEIKIISIEDLISFRKHLNCFENKDHYEHYLDR